MPGAAKPVRREVAELEGDAQGAGHPGGTDQGIRHSRLIRSPPGPQGGAPAGSDFTLPLGRSDASSVREWQVALRIKLLCNEPVAPRRC